MPLRCQDGLFRNMVVILPMGRGLDHIRPKLRSSALVPHNPYWTHFAASTHDASEFRIIVSQPAPIVSRCCDSSRLAAQSDD